MSIIHDALKKVQQSLASKADKTPDQQPPPTEAQQNTGYLYATPAPIDPATQETAPTKTLKQAVPKKINSMLALLCAFVITIVSLGFIFQELKQGLKIDIPIDIPKVQKKLLLSYYKLIHKKVQPDFKTKAPEDLKPLGTLTINSPAVSPSNTPQPPAGLKLNIHGVMANSSGNLILINNQVYQEGDEVEGAKIVKINLDSITIINNGKEQTIPIQK